MEEGMGREGKERKGKGKRKGIGGLGNGTKYRGRKTAARSSPLGP